MRFQATQIIFFNIFEYNCFTMLCQFLPYNKVNQLYVYIYPHNPSLLHLPPTLPTPPLQVVKKHQAHLPVLCMCFPLATYFIFSGRTHKLLYIYIFFLIKIWLIYSVSGIQQSDSAYVYIFSLYIYTYIYIHTYIFFQIIFLHRLLQVIEYSSYSSLPVLYSRSLQFICFKYSSVYMLIPNSQFIPPPTFLLW